MAVANREKEMMAMAFNLAPWMPFGELTAFADEVDKYLYLTGEKADTGDQADMSERDMNIAGIYFREMGKLPLLTREREIELARRIQLGEHKIHVLLQRCSADEEEVERLDHELYSSDSKPRKRVRSQEELITELEQKLEKLDQPYGGNGNRLRDMLAELKKTEADVKAAKSEMIQSNLRLVVCIAKKYINRGLSFLDLIQEGNLGLMRAIGRYDYRRGYKFSTYASWWIRQAITRALGDKSRIIRIPNHLLDLKSKILKNFHQLVKELGRNPMPEEIAAKTNIPLADVQKLMELTQEPISLETPVGDDGGKLKDLIADEDNMSFDNDLLENMDQVKKMRELLSLLDSREEQILRLRFGIGEPSSYTLEEVGDRFGISRERVRQIEEKALDKLKVKPRAIAIHGESPEDS